MTARFPSGLPCGGGSGCVSRCVGAGREKREPRSRADRQSRRRRQCEMGAKSSTAVFGSGFVSSYERRCTPGRMYGMTLTQREGVKLKSKVILTAKLWGHGERYDRSGDRTEDRCAGGQVDGSGICAACGMRSGQARTSAPILPFSTRPPPLSARDAEHPTSQLREVGSCSFISLLIQHTKMAPKQPIKVGILGATGTVGQR